MGVQQMHVAFAEVDISEHTSERHANGFAECVHACFVDDSRAASSVNACKRFRCATFTSSSHELNTHRFCICVIFQIFPCVPVEQCATEFDVSNLCMDFPV